MKLTNETNARKYLEEGGAFIINTKAPFNDVNNIAKLAIAEYLANKDGFTLYASVAKLED